MIVWEKKKKKKNIEIELLKIYNIYTGRVPWTNEEGKKLSWKGLGFVM